METMRTKMPLILRNLEIDGYRGLRKLKLENLGRVNLLIGRNNSGKTRVLDAVRLLSEGGSPEVISKICEEHDEHFERNIEKTQNNNANFIRHLFSGRKLPNTNEETISIGDKERNITISMMTALIKEGEDGSTIELREGDLTEEEKDNPNLRRAFVTTIQEGRKKKRRIVAIEDNSDPESFRMRRRPSRAFLGIKDGTLSHRFVPPRLIDHKELALLWDSVVLTEKEKGIIDILRIIQKDIEGLAFVSTGALSPPPFFEERQPILRIRSEADPIPLGSMGDGVYRILQLALNIVNAKHGFLLIDEFENGLHYSIQKDIWEFIFESSKNLNIQVFATTHSLDCIKAFSLAATEHEEIGCAYHLSQSTIDGSIIATRYAEDRLKQLVIDLNRDVR